MEFMNVLWDVSDFVCAWNKLFFHSDGEIICDFLNDFIDYLERKKLSSLCVHDKKWFTIDKIIHKR